MPHEVRNEPGSQKLDSSTVGTRPVQPPKAYKTTPKNNSHIMPIFRSKSGREVEVPNTRDTKMHAAAMHDPILTAVNEAQPFEQAAEHTARRPSYLSQEAENLKDIFGSPINQSDMSNPTRSRNERPLDTIRGFEYAITGDLSYRDQLETHRLGWGFHDDFQLPTAAYGNQGGSMPAETRPAINFDDGNSQPMYQANNYSASDLKEKGNKKKKRGFFGRKK